VLNNPFVIGLLGILIRQVLLVIAGSLGVGPAVHAYLDAHMTEANQFFVGMAAALLLLAYSVRKWFSGRQKFAQVLQYAGVTEREVEAMIKDDRVETPSVLAKKTEVPS
jgi:hypothetical protein